VSDSSSARIEKLESQLAFLERQYDQLNEVVVEQSRQLTRLQTELARATQTLTGIELDRVRANNQKPPHYQ
jgi:uncharacterized coiled-coil protein SlyX